MIISLTSSKIFALHERIWNPRLLYSGLEPRSVDIHCRAKGLPGERYQGDQARE